MLDSLFSIEYDLLTKQGREGMRMAEPSIGIEAVGHGSRDEWSGMLYEVRSPRGYNFDGQHVYIECGKRAANEMAARLTLTKCEHDCDCMEGATE